MASDDRSEPSRTRCTTYLAAVVVLALAAAGCGGTRSATGAPTGTPPTDAVATAFITGVDHPFFPLGPTSRWEYEVETPEGSVDELVAEVTGEVRTVNGVETTVVRVTLTVDGEVEEDTFSWYAQDEGGNVWLFGEIDHGYEGGVLAETTTWEAGVDGAVAGIVVPAEPTVGHEYRVGLVEGSMEEMARIVELDASVSVGAGTFSDLLVIENWCQLEPDVVERKFYAGGVGLVHQDSDSSDTDIVSLTSFEN